MNFGLYQPGQSRLDSDLFLLSHYRLGEDNNMHYVCSEGKAHKVSMNLLKRKLDPVDGKLSGMQRLFSQQISI